MYSCDEILKRILKQSFYKDEFGRIEPIDFFVELEGYWVMVIDNSTEDGDTFYYVLEGKGLSLYEEEKFGHLPTAEKKFLNCVSDYLR